jgi:hypothetical protein
LPLSSSPFRTTMYNWGLVQGLFVSIVFVAFF